MPITETQIPPVTPPEARQRNTASYRIWVSPTVRAQIESLASQLGVDHKRLMSVWVAEMVAAKTAQMKLPERMGESFARLFAEQMEEVDAERKAEAAT